jgi:hypothetical protein
MPDITIPASIVDGVAASSTLTAVTNSSLNGLTLTFRDSMGNSYAAACDTSVAHTASTAVKIGCSSVSVAQLASAVYESLRQASLYGVTSSVHDTGDGSVALRITPANPATAGSSGSFKSLGVSSLNGLTLIFQDALGNTYSAACDTSVTAANSTAVVIGCSSATITTLADAVFNSISQALIYGVTASTKDTADGSELLDVTVTSANHPVAATATFTFSDKPDEASTITIIDSDGTAAVFEVDNEANGVSGSNIALDGIAAAGGDLTGTAADLVAKINAQASLDISATNPSAGVVVLTQSTTGVGGNTTITVNNTSHWNTVCSVNVPSALTGGLDKAQATFTFSDKPDEASTIQLVDSDGTTVVFEIDNEADGVTGGNVALDGIAAAGGSLTGTAADLVAKINAQSALDIVATNPSAGVVVLTQGTIGDVGETTITTNSSSHWNTVCSVNVPSAFTSGYGSEVVVVQKGYGGSGDVTPSGTLVSGANSSFAAFTGGETGLGSSFTVTQAVAGTAGNVTPAGTLLSADATLPAFTGGTGGATEFIASVRADYISPSAPTTGAVHIGGFQVKREGHVNHAVGVPFMVKKTYTYADFASLGAATTTTYDMIQVASGGNGWAVLSVNAHLATPFSSSGVTVQMGDTSSWRSDDTDSLVLSKTIGSTRSANTLVGHTNAEKGALMSSLNNVVFLPGSSDAVTVTFTDAAGLRNLTAGSLVVSAVIVLSPDTDYA